MSGITLLAKLTFTTANIDLANYSLTNERAVAGLDDPANKLVSQRAAEPRIAFRDFEVSITNPCCDNLDQSFALATRNWRIAN